MVFTIFLLLPQGCKRCEGPCCNYQHVYYMNTQLFPYLFKTGTYWVYKNETTGAIDSEYVYSYLHDTTRVSTLGSYECGSYSNERWYDSCLSFYNGNLIDTTIIGGQAQFAGLPQWITIYNNICNSGPNPTHEPQVIFILDALSNYNYGGVYYYGTIPSLTVNGVPYQQVQQFYLNIMQTTSQVDSLSTKYYIEKNIGIVRTTTYSSNNADSTSWDLINKRIVQ
jgi:hypothetical protein